MADAPSLTVSEDNSSSESNGAAQLQATTPKLSATAKAFIPNFSKPVLKPVKIIH